MFSGIMSFSAIGIELHILEPTRAAVSIAYLTVQMFLDLNLNSFFRGYGDSIMSKIAFIVSGVSFFLTLNILISKLRKLRSWILKEPSFAKSSSNVGLWSWNTILKDLSWMRFIWLFNFRLWNFQTTGA